MAGKDWHGWHDGYDQPGSVLARRLAAVRERIRVALGGFADGPVRVVSLCAGQGHDLIGVLAEHPRGGDVTARLVELDPRNAAVARAMAERAGLPRVEVRVGDAALTDLYADLVPADLVLVCGVFGNISDADIERTVKHCAPLCRAGGLVVWTRHRRPPDLVPRICGWFEQEGFALEWLSGPGEGFGVGVHRYGGQPRPLPTGVRMFTFAGAAA